MYQKGGAILCINYIIIVYIAYFIIFFSLK